MKRRTLLSTMGAAAIAGCGDPGGQSDPDTECYGDCENVDITVDHDSFSSGHTKISIVFDERVKAEAEIVALDGDEALWTRTEDSTGRAIVVKQNPSDDPKTIEVYLEVTSY